MSKQRTFTRVLPGGYESGRYTGSTPAAAAKKAGSEAMNDSSAWRKIVIVRETTRGGPGKQYRYAVQKQKALPKGVRFPGAGVVVFEKEYSVHAR